MVHKFHYWIKVHKNPLKGGGGWLAFNLFDVHSINVVWDAEEDRPLAVQVATEAAQFNLDGCGMAQFFVAWEEFQKVSEAAQEAGGGDLSRHYVFEGEAPEVGLIRPATVAEIPS